MRKFYFITATLRSYARRLAIPADHGFRRVSGGSSASNTQMQDIRTNNADVNVLHSVLIFDRRAAARAAAKVMTVEQGGLYVYSVREVGEFKRTVRPVLGYRFKRSDGGGEWYNEAYQGPASMAAAEAEVGGLIPTRALARAALPEQQKSANMDHHDKFGKKLKLSIETVYADA